MRSPLSLTMFVGWIALLVAAPVAGGYESLGVTRAAVEDMLKAEGLNPRLNTYPDFEGERVTELSVFNPFISIQLYGPDSGLTAIEVTLRPSADANDAHWQNYISLWVLNAVFPDWENREEWLTRTLKSFARFGNEEVVEFQREGRNIQTAFKEKLFFFAVSGKEVE